MSTSLNEYFDQWVLHWMNTSLNEYFTEWVLHWVSTSLNEYFTEWALHWVSTSLNEYFTEWVLPPCFLWGSEHATRSTLKRKTLKSPVARILWIFFNNFTFYLLNILGFYELTRKFKWNTKRTKYCTKLLNKTWKRAIL